MWAEHAAEAWAALTHDAFQIDRGSVRVLDGPRGHAATAWPLAHVLWAAGEIRSLGEDAPIEALTEDLERLRRGDGYAPTSRARYRYFDDNAWIGLASIRLHEVTGEPGWRERAERLAGFVRAGEHPLGGIRWVEGSESRNTCSTASSAWLAGVTSAPDGPDDAGRWMAWLHDTLLLDDGLYGDRIEEGEVDERVWSYNQGASIAALRAIDGERTSVIDAAIERWTPEALWAEPPAFLAILVRALADEPGLGERARAWIHPYLERLLAEARGEDGWFTGGGVGSYDGRPTIDQAAIVQMFAVAAAL